MKKKGRIIATSIASIAMCASLIAGGTYALFTSESAVNVAVTSGTVKVVATASEATLSSTLPDGNLQETTAVTEKNTVTLTNFVPGDKADFTITVSNESTVSVQYRTIIKCEEDDGLFSGLVVDIDGATYNGMTAVSSWEMLAPDSADEIIEVSVSLPEGKGDEYQNTSCKLSYTVEAVQGNAPVVDPLTKIDDTHYEVNNEWGMQLMTELANATPANYPVTETFLNFKLTADLDMTGYDYAPTNRYFINFDGDNHTISNLTAGYTTNGQGTSGLFGYAANVKNVTLENISVAGDQAGLIVARAGNNTISNVTITGKNTVEYKDVSPETWTGIGAFVGVNYEGVALSGVKVVEGATITLKYNGMMTECDYTADSFGGCFGANGIADTAVDNKGAINTEGEWYKKLSDGLALIEGEEKAYAVSNAVGLNTLNGMISANVTKVKLLDNIDMTGYKWKTVDMHADANGMLSEFDGNERTISNMEIDGAAMFWRLAPSGDLAVKNLTFDNVTVDTTAKNAAIITQQVYKNVTLDNVDVKNSEISGETKVATLVGSVFDEQDSIITLTVKNCDIENVTVTGNPEDKSEERLAGMVAWVADKTSGEAMVLANNTMTNVKIISNSTAVEHHAIVYLSDEAGEDGAVVKYAVHNDTADGVTVTNCKYMRANSYEAATQTELDDALEDTAYAKVNVTLNEGNYTLKGVSGKDVTISGTADTVLNVSGECGMNNSDVELNGVTVQTNSADYQGLTHSNSVTYNGVTFNGSMHLYGNKVVFNNCTFNLTSNYVWTYGAKEVEFNGCTFNTAGKSILIYNEGNGHTSTVTVKDCKFYATASWKAGEVNNQNCAAIELNNYANDNGHTNLTLKLEGTNTYDKAYFSGLWRIKRIIAGTSITVNGEEYKSTDGNVFLDGEAYEFIGDTKGVQKK